MNYKDSTKKRLTKTERLRFEGRGENISELDLAYEWLNEEHPDLFKDCPAEIKGKSVKKTSVARKFDDFSNGGLCFEDNYWEREANILTIDASEKEDESTEGSTIYYHIGFATPEDHARIASKTEEHYVRYDNVRKTEGERAFKRTQLTDSCYVEPGKTGTGTPETNVEPFDGYVEVNPLYTKKVYVEDRCATPWKDRKNFVRTIPHYLDCWLSTCLPGQGCVTHFLDNGLQTQIDEFGKKIFVPLRNNSAPTKYQVKEKALVNALSRAFSPRQKYASDSHLSLDTCPVDGNESSWTPLTEVPLDILIKEEQYRTITSRARLELSKVREFLGADKWVLLMESFKKTNAEIAADINANGGDTNTNAVQKRVRRIREALASLTCPF